MKSDSSTQPGVITVSSVSVVDGLPASPQGLLDIAGAFDGRGYARLARYLRACSDVMAGKPPAAGEASAAQQDDSQGVHRVAIRMLVAAGFVTEEKAATAIRMARDVAPGAPESQP